MAHKKIRKTDLLPSGVLVRSLPLWHVGLASLRQLGVVLSGIDIRNAPQQWGEGVSPTHLLFFVMDGTVEFVGEETPVIVTQGQLLIVPSSIAKRLTLSRGTLRALWFHLQDTSAWSQLRTPHTMVRSMKYGEILDAAQQQLLAECRSDDAGTRETPRLLSQLIAKYLLRELSGDESPDSRRMQTRLDALWDDVNAHPAEHWSVEALAAQMQISAGYFHRVVRSMMHVRPMEVVTRIRMEHAASLLRNTDWTIERIASAVGYQSPYAFSHAFQRHTGMRPGGFRRQ